MDICLDTPQWHREPLGDLFVGVLLEETHPKELLVTGLEVRYTLLDLSPLLTIYDTLLGVGTPLLGG